MPFLQVRITSGRSGGGDSKVRGERKPLECMLDYINSKIQYAIVNLRWFKFVNTKIHNQLPRRDNGKIEKIHGQFTFYKFPDQNY